MVTLDPCERLKTIKTQLIPSILSSATLETDTLDIKAAIEETLPELEMQCYKLLDKCENKWPDCGNQIEICNREKIKELFQDTREKLKKIWEEKEKKAGEGSDGT